MVELIIDPELRDWIFPLKQDEYNGLEKSIKEEGCRDPIVIWNNIVVDGHNRYNICKDNNIEFKTVEMKFDDKHTAKHWMVKNQCSKRNLEPIQRIQLVLKYEEECAKKAKEQQGTRTDILTISSKSIDNIIEEEPYVHKEVHIQTKPKVVIVPINTRKECSAISNVSEDTFRKAKEVLQKAAPEVVSKLNAGEITINRAYTDIKREEKKIERQIDIVKNPVIPDGKFNVILADPPWRYDFNNSSGRQIENHYPTMEINDIKKLSLPIEDNAVLFLWATAPKLPEALEVMSAWGFTYKTNAIWDKEKIGMGYWFRGQHELLLVGTKGQFRAPDDTERVSSVIKSPRTTHSTKPVIVYEMLEKMFPNKKYLEVFARDNREGWTSWGNQC